jgi:hypothetical protein
MMEYSLRNGMMDFASGRPLNSPSDNMRDISRQSIIIAVFKIVGTATTLQLFGAVVAAKLQTIVSHSFLHRFPRFCK